MNCRSSTRQSAPTRPVAQARFFRVSASADAIAVSTYTSSKRTFSHPIAVNVTGAPFAGCSSLPNNVGTKVPAPELSATYALSLKEAGLDCQHLQERSVALKDQMDVIAGQALEVMQWEPQTIASSFNRLLGFPGAEAPEIADFNELRAESLAIDRARAQKGCVPGKPSQNL